MPINLLVQYYRDLHDEDVEIFWMSGDGQSGMIQSDDREVTISEIKDLIAAELKEDRSNIVLEEGSSTVKFFVENKHHV